MRAEALSLRQLAVLAVTALLAPTADWLPGIVARTGGAAGWLAPVVALPVLMLWLWLLTDLFAREGSDLATVARQGLGKWLGGGLLVLYIMWGVALLAGQLHRSALRMGAVYGEGAGRNLALLALALALWMVWKKVAALCRAGEMLWLALGVGVLGLIALAVPQVEPARLLHRKMEWQGLAAAGGSCLLAFAPALLTTALMGQMPRGQGGRRRAWAWMVALCAMASLLLGAVMGQMGPRLTQTIPQPFLIMVQGLSLQGALARLEAVVAALWLIADFAYAGLVLAAVGMLAGERWGKWTIFGTALLAGASQNWPDWQRWGAVGSLVLGFGLPVLLWVLCKTAKRGKIKGTSCG